MKLSPSNSQLPKEKEPMKRILLVLGAAILFASTLVVPTAVKADGTPTGGNCGMTLCKP
jgi:hypothetical protein